MTDKWMCLPLRLLTSSSAIRFVWKRFSVKELLSKESRLELQALNQISYSNFNNEATVEEPL